MYLRIEGQNVAAFMASAAWRAWLYYPASAVDGTDRDRILLDSGMGLRECQEMLEAIMKADGHGVEVMVDQSFDAFVNASETYIRERSEVGLAIKAQTALMAFFLPISSSECHRTHTLRFRPCKASTKPYRN